MNDSEAYGNFNMGAGFALYLPKTEVRKVWEVLEDYKHPLIVSAPATPDTLNGATKRKSLSNRRS